MRVYELRVPAPNEMHIPVWIYDRKGDFGNNNTTPQANVQQRPHKKKEKNSRIDV